MKVLLEIASAMILATSLFAGPRDVKVTFDLLKKGKSLSADEAAKLTEQLNKKPKDEDARIQLLSYYSSPHAGRDLEATKAWRSSQIRWIIENDPKEGLGLFNIATGVYRLHCQGDDLADPDAFDTVAELWQTQLTKKPDDTAILAHAIDFIQYCAPEKAERILLDAHDQTRLGRLYAYAVLGITGQSYEGNDPAGTDPTWRKRVFAEKARKVLEESTDKDLVVSAAIAILRDGAILWADGNLDWDYTPLGNSLLARAKDLAPDNMTLVTLRTTLPVRGERPPLTIRVGGNVQAANLTKKVTPRYPNDAREQHIQGSVQMTALVGLDGKILKIHADSGPPELIPSSVNAALQWEYKPTLLNGKPCYVITLISINFELSPR